MTTKEEILYEDNHLIIINKRPGELVQGDKTGDRTLAEDVKEYIKKAYKKPGNVFLGVTHRIDRPVSGAVIFARTGKALARINEMLKERTIKKIYWAVVKEEPQELEGRLTHFIEKNEKKNKAIVNNKQNKNNKKAELSYKVIKKSDQYTLLEIELHTGRHHQIRAQLSKIGSPIKGDLKYGYNRSNKDGSIHLHARELHFIHPVKKEPVKVVAATPDDNLWRFFS